MKKVFLFFAAVISLYSAQYQFNENINFNSYITNILNSMPQYKQMINNRFPKLLQNFYYLSKNYNKKEIPTIFYFTSSSVPVTTLENILISLSKLKNEYEIETAQIFKGFSLDSSWKRYLNKIVKDSNSNKILKKAVRENLEWRVDPKAFEELNITRVPVIAFALCPSKSIYPSDCEIMYIERGDISLLEFFYDLSNINENFSPYYYTLGK